MLVLRTRLAVSFISFAVVGLELALMRVLSLRFWHHVAAMVISIALLGFGASGTVLTLWRKRLVTRRREWLLLFSFAFALSIPITAWAAQRVPLDIQFMAWNVSGEWLHVLAVECLMLVPFVFAGGFVGLVLMEHPDLISGHYAANMVGSGAGAVGIIMLMSMVEVDGLLMVMAAVAYLGGAWLIKPEHPVSVVAAVVVGAGLLLVHWQIPPKVSISPYKKLSLEMSKPDSEVLLHTFGPMGQIDVVRGPAIHDAPPGMSLVNPYPIPPRVLLILDGDQTDIVYNTRQLQDWAFLDYSTGALAYHLVEHPAVLIIGAGGGASLGQALYHQSREIVALEANIDIIELMKGPLAELGGAICEFPGVHVLWQEARGYLAGTSRQFDIIQIPLLDHPGSPGGGLQAAHESFLFTVESLEAILARLTESGVASITVFANDPPRDGLRIFDTAARALRNRGIKPLEHLALIRSWETVTLLASRRAWREEQVNRIRAFCQDRGFDLCYLPGLDPSEVNQFHVLDGPRFFEGTQALLGDNRQSFLDDYVFAVEAPTDDRPFFHNFLRWRTLPRLQEQLKGSLPAFLEAGSLLLVVALVQAGLLAGTLIIVPLLPGLRRRRKSAPEPELQERAGGGQLKGANQTASSPRPGVSASKTVTLAYFFLLGIGFMLLEMAFLQKLILYLAHPIYSAAVVIGTFLVFAGVGSQMSGRWTSHPLRAGTGAAVMIASLTLLYLAFIDDWLGLTHSWPLSWRLLFASATVAPLAVAMGHLFPMGLRRVGASAPLLVPWAWGVNGFASVIATVSAPLVAMSSGFSRVTLIAAVCYLLTGFLFRYLSKG